MEKGKTDTLQEAEDMSRKETMTRSQQSLLNVLLSKISVLKSAVTPEEIADELAAREAKENGHAQTYR